MPTSYLQDEDEDQVPFYLRDPQEDTFDTGDPATMGGPSYVGSPQPSAPTPELQSILRQPPSRPDIMGAPEIQNANAAMDRLAAAKRQVPVPQPPKWWQRVGAGIVGGMAGYANASGHRGVHIDPTAAEQGILGAGKYQQSLANYNAEVTGAQADVDAANAEQNAWWRNRQLQTVEQRAAADEEEKRARATKETEANATSERARKLASDEKLEAALIKPWGEDVTLQKDSEPVPPGMEVTRSLTQPGMVYVHPPKYVKMTDDLAPYAAGREAGETVPYSEFKRAQTVAAKDTVQQNKPVKPPADNVDRILLNPDQYTPDQVRKAQQMFDRTHREPRDPNAPKPVTPQMMRGIEQKKNDRLNALETAAQHRVAQGEDRESVYAELAPQKQRIQDEYEGEISAATGNYPGHFDYGTQAQRPAAPTPAPAPQRTGGRGASPQPQIAEGTVIVNRKTGERQVLRGGQWVPAPTQ